MAKADTPCMLVILDGWGVNPSAEGNAFAAANTPNLDRLFAEYPSTQLACSGKDVGLPPGYMGNSEVGHMNMGAGRIVYQDLMRINIAIEDGKFFENPVLVEAVEKAAGTGATLHLLGLLSDGGVHSHIDHAKALVRLAEGKGAKTALHAILDGRDTPPDSGVRYVADMCGFLSSYKNASLATICGRYYAMDRDTRWDRTKKAYDLYMLGEGAKYKDPVQAVKESYSRGETDEFVLPVAITDDGGDPIATVRDGDCIIFFNFRADRMRQIVRAFTEPSFGKFEKKVSPRPALAVCMTEYDESFTLPVAFPPENLVNTLGEVISNMGYAQLRIAETEKYAHVTYFFSGGREEPFPCEERKLIPSPRDVATYDLKPQMSALEVADELVSRIGQNKYDLIVVNFANMDMVGHTGVFEAAVKACETVDAAVGRIVPEFLKTGGVVLVTADHGNSEQMKDENGSPHTAHTTNPVPLILLDDKRKTANLSKGRLADIAPTILFIMNIEKPPEMTGRVLFKTD